MVKKSYQSREENLFQRYRELEFQKFQAGRTAGEGGDTERVTQQTRNGHHSVLAQGCPSVGRGSRGSSYNPGSPVKISW